MQYYYNNICGSAATPDEELRTACTVAYLYESGFSPTEIRQVIDECPAVPALTISDLPEFVWRDSLVVRNRFYYHRVLHLSPPLYFDINKGVEQYKTFYLEIKPRFSLDDLVKRFWQVRRAPNELTNLAKDKGAFRYLLEQYQRIDMEPLDFVLALIDWSAANPGWRNSYSPLDLQEYEHEVLDDMKSKIAQARFAKADKIVWRDEPNLTQSQQEQL